MPRILERRDGDVLAAGRRLAEVGTRLLRPYEQRLSRSAATLDALSPLRVLARGYAIAKDEQGHVVSRAEQLQVGDVVDLRFGAGGAQARVESLIPDAAGGADAPGNRDAAEETLPAAKR
jgi:exodeoxyribonuclease VII large subunit